jgi:hypothetical protein
MLRQLMMAALLWSAATAQARTAGGPPIAYVKRLSTGDEIYLVKPDQTELTRLYKAPSKLQITMLDLRPGGSEIAFLEGYTKLKILAFDSYGRAEPGNPRTVRTTISPCSVESPDYHPTNGTLLFVEGCGRNRAVRLVQPGAKEPASGALFSSVAVFRARWSRLGDAVYYIGLREGAASSDPTYLYRRLGTADAQEMGVLNDWNTFDVARVGEKIYWGSEPRFYLLDLSNGATTNDAVALTCPSGSRMTRSPDDTQMVFQSVWARGKGNYIMLGVTSCLADPTAMTGAGTWGWTDWRTD